ncbi:MAG: efflux RND transporter permease subunit, partial [Sulfurimonas sp.]
MSSIISFALKQRLFVLLLALLLAGVGVNSYKNLPIDAFPNIAPTQVKIIIKSDGLTPTEMESNVLLPIESQMLGIESQTTLRSIAKYGICDITIDFKDGTDIYWARSQVSERLNAIMGELPKNIKGGLAPISTPLSDVLMFSVESP